MEVPEGGNPLGPGQSWTGLPVTKGLTWGRVPSYAGAGLFGECFA